MFISGFFDKLRRAPNLAAITDIEHHFYTQALAELVLRNVVLLSVAAIGKYVRPYQFYLAADRNVFGILVMPGNMHAVNEPERFNDLFAVCFGHERKSLFKTEPIVVVDNDHKFIAQFLGLLKQAHMADMHRIKSSTDHYYFFIWHVTSTSRGFYCFPYRSIISSIISQFIILLLCSQRRGQCVLAAWRDHYQ